MQKNRVVLTCDPSNCFFLLYKCVNDVSSYGTYYFQDNTLDERCSSVHLRSRDENFVDQMTRRLHPLYDSSSHLSFLTTNLNNITTRGWDVDSVYFANVQSAYLGYAFDRIGHVQSQFSTNNRNYTALIHGVENRQACLSAVEKQDSVKFSRNCSFPPLTWNVTYSREDEESVVCRSQIYDKSFAVNTQRQTDKSLLETTKCILSHLLAFALVDYSLNHLCVDWEVKLGRNLSFPEKCQLLVFLEVARHKCGKDPEMFQSECGSFVLSEYDDAFAKNMYSLKRLSRNNPEMSDLFGRLPIALQQVVTTRWKMEGKNISGYSQDQVACMCQLPTDIDDWVVADVHRVVKCLMSGKCRRKVPIDM